MKAFFNTLGFFAISCFLFEFTQAQEASLLEISSPDAGKNQIHTNQQTGSWSFGLGGGASFASNNNESALFRGKNLSTKMFARYTFGSFGLSASTGILPGGISNHSLNQFIKERGLPQEELNITKSNSLNGFLTAGPSFRFGGEIYFNADLQGGLFFNNPGIVQITQQGDTKPLYQFSNGDKELSPGFSGSISVNYPVSHSTHFFINADYLHSSSSVRLLDPKEGFDQPTLIKRNLQLMVFGAGIVKSFGSNSKTKRQDKSTSASGNCGPVTFTNTKPDGSIEQFIFACPDDAAKYSQRLNAIPATTKQSQGVTFGEKVSANTIQDTGRRTNTDQHWGDPHENLNGRLASSQERKGWDGSVKGSYKTEVENNDQQNLPGQDFNTTRSNRERGQFHTNPDNNHSIMEKDIADNALTEADLDGDGIPELSILSVNGAVADINLLMKGNKRAIEISPSSKGIQEAGIKRSAEAAVHWGDPHENVNGKHARKSITRGNGNLTTSPISSKIIHSPNGNMLVLTANAGDYPERLKKMPPTEPIKGAEIWMESKDGTLYKRITDDNGSFDLTGIPTGQTLSISMNMAIDGKEDILIQFPTTHPSGTSVATVLKTRHETAKNSISNVR